MKNIFYLMLFITSVSCTLHESSSPTSIINDTIPLLEARGFKIVKHVGYHELIIFNPWQGAKNVDIHYYLAHNPSQVKETNGIIIQTPVKKVICLSTTHIAMIDALGEIESISAISGSYLVSNKSVLSKLKLGKIIDVNYQDNINYELILGLKPDVIFAYGIDTEFANYVKKLKDFGFKVVFNAEYLENEPLAKTEWIKFMSVFYDKLDRATDIFDTISTRYKILKEEAKGIKNKPKILYGLPWNGTWYMAGGRSYASKLIADAGGDFLWANTESHEALPLSIESVIMKCDSADIWINAGAALSRADIIAVDKRLADLKIVKQGKIVNNFAIVSPSGGSDYWESGVMNPDVVLKDLISIFHPELFPNYKLYYYKSL